MALGTWEINGIVGQAVANFHGGADVLAKRIMLAAKAFELGGLRCGIRCAGLRIP